MAQQKNTFIEDAQDPRKYEVGQRLEFVGYNPEELAFSSVEDGFEPRDILIVMEKNRSGIGITVGRKSDGKIDMVWPEEVELAREKK